MKTTLFALMLMTLAPVAMAADDPADEATGVFESFLTALTNLEIDNIVNLFADDALFWGTSRQFLSSDITGIREYFSVLSGGQPGQSIARARDYTTRVINDDLVLISGIWEVVQRGNDSGTALRVSLVVANRDGDWKIIQFHNSALPQ